MSPSSSAGSPRGRRLILLVLGAVLLLAGPANAQRDWDSRRALMTRELLERLLADLDEASRSPAYSSTLRERSRREAVLVRERLADGDFQVGDRVLINVEGEAAISDTFAVAEGRVLVLPTYGDVELHGVLRSELQPHLTRFIGRFIRAPNVRARSLFRMSLLGEVNTPGFYVLASDMLVTDALMLAGGPTQNSELTKVRIERGSRNIWEGEALQQGITEGRTLDQLNLRAGDRVIVPRRSRINVLQVIGAAGGLTTFIVALTQIF